MKVACLIVSSLAAAGAFTAPVATSNHARIGSRYAEIQVSSLMMTEESEVESSDNNDNKAPIPAVTAALWAMTSTSAMAAGPDWGLFEGKTGSLLHPAMMFSMLALSVSTAFLGFDWRRQRTIGDDISALKKTLPDLGGASSLSAALAAAEAAEPKDSVLIAKLKQAAPIESQITALQTERKELSAKGARDKHYSQGTLLAFLGTCFAIEGPLNTYARAGKLFPGPHLYAGAGLVCLWALAAACVPSMQKGSDTARTIHIGANLAGIGLFAWQVQSGIPILLKVWEKTSWP